jgi:hypothetical protein
LRDNIPEEQGGSSSLNLLLAPPSSRYRRKGGVAAVSLVGSCSTERDAEDNQSFRLNPAHSAQSNTKSTLPSTAHTYVDATSSDVLSRISYLANIFKMTLYPVQRPSLSPTGERGTHHDTTRNDGQARDNADVKHNGAEFALPAQKIPSPVTSGSGSSVSLPAPLQSSEDVCRTSTTDRYRIFDREAISRHPSETLIQLMWLALQDRVLVC